MRILVLIMAALVANTSFAQKNKWVKLFDGKSLEHWYSWNVNDGNSTAGWSVVNGELTTDGKGGDLVTKKEYENFELEFEFKVSPKGNSGVIYKVQDKQKEKEQPYIYGPEYQIIDDVNYPSTPKDVHKTGGNYDVYAPSDLSAVKPAGEWNKGKIKILNNKVEHWLNGKKVIEYEYASPKWVEDIAKSKFKSWPYATPHAKGKISLQGHGDTVWFKNIRIKEL
ncbi:protein of unknown function DUF1080 [Leadbetterella byssophila DSM 17132]|uniref:3-keto-alpha-glucoside-1,2-lyase/3-keto-2-hydroxy-glucal hydratase domain-containing protein n=1 Tax=Leadbetterella byssophila (strain DSM 17132 / JCM 16389 / KACC 11308 / NBRC 106382 / 4M15) TaxID=649349 RepID=E4RZ27_LEAB4|nr:DUF1080 domain-containing protein [Leadbetterella byssophila]ADQ18246.1 protein of unknown function DUF1080 [Leadbetterella byssophila DSM 17132]